MDTIRYILYARKSTEGDDRQIQSIDDQIKIMTGVAKHLGLNVVKVVREAKSAKSPNNRPIFNDVLEKIENGQADGILCWQINRLSRNPVDSGRISWLLQKNILKVIQTHDRTYYPEDNVLLLSVESGMANQFILDLSKNVKRGIKGKVERGGWPGVAPVGYLNRLEDHSIIPDPKRFDLIRKAWELMLTGQFNVPAILVKLNRDMGFRTVVRKKSGDKPLSLSNLYKVFVSPFYKGVITHKDQEFDGVHQPMVTHDEFERVQILLGHKSKYRQRKHTFAYSGQIHCGECGCLIIAQEKTKVIKGTGEVRRYVYYNCTRKKVNVPCNQRKVIRQEELEKQIDQELSRYTILPEFKDWALEALRNSNDSEINIRAKQQESIRTTLTKTERQLDNLTKMRYKELINDEEFKKERKGLQGEINSLRSKVDQTYDRADHWLELTEKVFDFAVNARSAFLNGNVETKRTILMALGQNPTLKDRKITIVPFKWLQPIAEHYPALERQYLRLELTKKVSAKTKSDTKKQIISTWQGY